MIQTQSCPTPGPRKGSGGLIGWPPPSGLHIQEREGPWGDIGRNGPGPGDPGAGTPLWAAPGHQKINSLQEAFRNKYLAWREPGKTGPFQPY